MKQLTPRQRDVLEACLAAGGTIALEQLGKQLGGPATRPIALTVRPLAAAGLVSMQWLEAGRDYDVTLTPAGRAAIAPRRKCKAEQLDLLGGGKP